MHPNRHVDLSRSLDEDRTVEIKRRFFFMRDVAKSGHFIVDQTDQMRLKDDDSQINVQSDSLIKYETTRPTVGHNFSLN